MPFSSTARSVAEVPPAGSRGCATARPASVSSTASCRFERAGYAASRHPPDDGRRRAGLARRPGLPALLQHPFYVPRQHGSWPFFIKGSQHNQHSPLQWRRSAVLSHFQSSSGQMSFQEALMVGVNDLLSLYGDSLRYSHLWPVHARRSAAPALADSRR